MAEQAALIEKLQEEDAFIEFPPEAHAWTLAEIQTFYDTCGEIAPGEPEGQPQPEPQPEPEPEPEPKPERQPEPQPQKRRVPRRNLRPPKPQ